ncbi:MAG: MlaD family protein [Planctomycetota bacterium]|jgi:phospholipid/cholesterol/gamma-HCH transport system substrate-binding protein
MNERQLQFRVGLFVIAALSVVGVLIFQFGEVRDALAKRYDVLARFESAPGVLVGSPVRINGVQIGSVTRIHLDQQGGGVLLTMGIEDKYKLRSDSEPFLQQSLLGDTVVEITPGHSDLEFDRSSVLQGKAPFDMTAIVKKMDKQLETTMASFESTSREWQLVAKNINGLVQTNRGNLGVVVERTAKSLDEFSVAMQRAAQTFDNANRVIGDPQTVQNLRKALAGLPQIVTETQQTITAMRQTVTSINGNLKNIQGVTQPLAKHTTSIVVRLDRSLANLEALTGELRDVAQLAATSDGSLKKFLSDPSLYNDLENSAMSLSILLRNLQPVVQDMREFSDKVARRPEVLGVGGALRPSSGLRDDEVRQAGFEERE